MTVRDHLSIYDVHTISAKYHLSYRSVHMRPHKPLPSLPHCGRSQNFLTLLSTPPPSVWTS